MRGMAMGTGSIRGRVQGLDRHKRMGQVATRGTCRRSQASLTAAHEAKKGSPVTGSTDGPRSASAA